MIGALPSLLALSLAAAADYRLESSDWNGLATVAATASTVGCTIETRDRIEWDRLTGHDVLWLVYPRSHVDGDRLALFLDAGGRALIADDFGAADGALARLDIVRRSGSVEAGHHFHELAHLPEAVAWQSTPLSRATPTLVTNHPAWFVTPTPATWRFSPGQAAVVEGRLGRGSFVALSDPSVLINNMQELDQDRLFAAGLIALQCRPRVDRILLVTGEFTESGSPPATLRGAPDARRAMPTGAADRLNTGLEDLNDLLARAGDSPPEAVTLSALALAAVLTAVYLYARALPARSRRHDGGWTRARVVGRAAPASQNLPVTALREEARLRVAEALGEPASGLATDEIAAAVERRFGSHAAALAKSLWQEIGKLPERGPALSTVKIERLHRLALELFAALESPSTGAG